MIREAVDAISYCLSTPGFCSDVPNLAEGIDGSGAAPKPEKSVFDM